MNRTNSVKVVMSDGRVRQWGDGETREYGFEGGRLIVLFPGGSRFIFAPGVWETVETTPAPDIPDGAM